MASVLVLQLDYYSRNRERSFINKNDLNISGFFMQNSFNFRFL